MTRATIAFCALCVGAAGTLVAQAPIRVTAATTYESYSFDTAEPYFASMSQLAVPVGLYIPLGRTLEVAVSSGFASLKLAGDPAAGVGFDQDQDISGMLDTQLRLSWQVVPDRVVAFATGAIPTGMKTLTDTLQLNILAVLASDVIGFQVSNIGTGGSAGVGFGAAFPVGASWSVGFGGSTKLPFSYVPVSGVPNASGQDVQIRPGQEIRLRAGLEGAIGRTTYLRVAGVFARQNNDKANVAELNGVNDELNNVHGVGNRFVGYLSLNQQLGPGAFILYGYDVYRMDPTIEPVAIGAALLPPGNLIGVGARYEAQLSRQVRVAPRVEFRNSAQSLGNSAIDLNNATWNPISKVGDSWRFGADIVYEASRNISVVLVGSGFTGYLLLDALKPALTNRTRMDLTGWRFGVNLEWKP